MNPWLYYLLAEMTVANHLYSLSPLFLSAKWSCNLLHGVNMLCKFSAVPTKGGLESWLCPVLGLVIWSKPLLNVLI